MTVHRCFYAAGLGSLAPTPARPDRTPLASAKTWTLIAAVLGSSITYLDATIVTVALPRIGRDLPVHLFGVLEGQSYVYNGYLLTESALIILAGALGDAFGRRRMFTLGVAAFGAASTLCGLAPTMEWLIFFRVLQGAAGALLVPGALSLISATFDGEEKGRAIGTWSGTAAATGVLGPFVGGLLVDALSWRVAFLINIPIAAVTLWVARRHVAESRDTAAPTTFDLTGTVLTALAVGGLAFGTIYGGQHEWRGPLAYISLAAGTAAALALPLQMTRAAHPLVPPELFRSRNFVVTNLMTFIVYGAMAVVFYYLPLFLQGTLGYTAAAVGLATVPPGLLLAMFSTRVGAVAGRFGPRWFMAAGPAIMASGALMLARIPASSAAWTMRPGDPQSFLPPAGYLTDFLPGLLLFGLGTAIMVAPLTTALMTSVSARHGGVASAINNAVAEVGPQLISAAVFAAITASFYASLAAQVPGLDPSSATVRQRIAPLNPPAAGAPASEAAAARRASTRAFHIGMLAAAALLFAGAAVSAAGIENRPAPVDSS